MDTANPEPSTTNQISSLKTRFIIIAVIAALSILAGVGFAAFKHNTRTTTSIKNNPTVLVTPTITWKTYTDATYGYTISYPANWVIDTTQPDHAKEGYTQAQLADCQDRAVKLQTPEAYTLKFDYNLGGCPVIDNDYVFKQSTPITIDSQPYIKAYTNNCGVPSDFPTCNSEFSRIVFVSQSQIYSQGNTVSQISEQFTLHGKLATLIFALDAEHNQKVLPLNDAGFATTDRILNQVISSIRFLSTTSISTPTSTFVPTALPGSQIYTSNKLGITFDYVSAIASVPVPVTENGNTITVEDQTVQVFSKIPTDTLEQAIKTSILQGYKPADCPFIGEGANLQYYPLSYQTVVVRYASNNRAAIGVGGNQQIQQSAP